MSRVNKQRLYSQIDKTNPGRYDARLSEIDAIVERYETDRYSIASDAFLFGFLKGQRAARAEIDRMIIDKRSMA